MLCVLWVRSCYVVDYTDLAVSAHGKVYFSPSLYIEPVGKKAGSAESYGLFGNSVRIFSISNVKVVPLPGTGPTIPYLLFVFVATVLATSPWLRFHFSLRTLLIATTLVAVALGLIVWAGL